MKHLSLMGFAILLTGCAETIHSTRSRTPSTPGTVQTTTSEAGVIPAGTKLVIRTNETIDSSKGTVEGRTFSAQAAADIVDQNGRVLIAKGSPVTLAVVDQGKSTLELAVRSVTVNGNNYLVQTDTETEGREGLGRNRRTAEMVGGGAVLGTLIGAIAGGGSGAAIGAAVGAAGGAAVQVLTQGKEVRVPAETVLTFRLDAPLRLVGYRG